MFVQLMLLQGGILCVLVLGGVGSSKVSVTIDDQMNCDTFSRYPLYTYDEVAISYYGDHLEEECAVRIYEDFNHGRICLTIDTLDIYDCSNIVKLYGGSHIGEPDVQYSCGSTTPLPEFCTVINNMNVVIVNTGSSSSNTVVKLRAYMKDKNTWGGTTSSSSGTIIGAAIGGFALVVMLLLVIACIRRRQQSAMYARSQAYPPVQFQNQAPQPVPYQPPPQGYQPPPPQRYQPAPPQGYQPPPQGYQPPPPQGYQPPPTQGYQAPQHGYQPSAPQAYQPHLPQGYQQGYQPPTQTQDYPTEKKMDEPPPPYPGQ